VFTYAEALCSGWTSSALDHAVRTGRLDRLRPGVFRGPQETPTDRFAAARDAMLAAAVAAALTNPGSVLSHTSAAIAHQLPVWRLPTAPCLTVPPRFTGELPGVHLHRASSPLSHVAAHPLPVHGVERTVIDVGREHGPLDALVIADAALHLRLTDPLSLAARLRECRGWPGVRAAREAIELADRRAESPLESASRYRLCNRVPDPELQASIYDLDGKLLGRCDFLWEEAGVAGEAHGMEKFDKGLVTPAAEFRRQERLERSGLLVVRWDAADLSNVDALVRRLHERFAAARRLELPRRWTAQLTPRSAPALHL
jgi:hypothetical protein